MMCPHGPTFSLRFVSSDRVDTDFMAKWLDVYPDGRRMLIQDGAVRMRWLYSDEKALCIVPGKVRQLSPCRLYSLLIFLFPHIFISVFIHLNLISLSLCLCIDPYFPYSITLQIYNISVMLQHTAFILNKGHALGKSICSERERDGERERYKKSKYIVTPLIPRPTFGQQKIVSSFCLQWVGRIVHVRKAGRVGERTTR